MTTAERVLANVTSVLAILFGLGSLALFMLVPAGSLRVMPARWSEAGVLWWDAALCLAFFLQHSGMVRKGFRARLGQVVPPRYHRAIYAIASGIVLTGLVVFWQPSENRVLVLAGPYLWLAHGVAVLALVLFGWSATALRTFDGFGLAPIRAWLRGREEPPSVFVVRGPYRWVRHPWYLCALLLFWSRPELTSDGLLFNLLWSAWIIVGAKLEEGDLATEFGAAYGEYRRKVPMLIPWRGWRTARLGSSARTSVRAAGVLAAHPGDDRRGAAHAG
jgi:hypothetical protein